MVKSYLEKILNQLLERRIEISNSIIDLSNRQKESVQLIKLLEESNDSTIENFTPRELNSFNKSKVIELRNLQKELHKEMERVNEKLYKIDNEISELNSIIILVHKNEKENTQSLTSVLYKIENCSEMIDTNPYQCKKELQVIEKMIKNMM